jgi:hypothetical protein
MVVKALGSSEKSEISEQQTKVALIFPSATDHFDGIVVAKFLKDPMHTLQTDDPSPIERPLLIGGW